MFDGNAQGEYASFLSIKLIIYSILLILFTTLETQYNQYIPIMHLANKYQDVMANWTVSPKTGTIVTSVGTDI